MNSVFLIDGGFISHKLRQSGKQVKPPDILQFVSRVRELHDKDYRLLRIYYYDCPPSAVKAKLPVSKNPVDFGATPQFKLQSQFFAELKRADFTAVREGRLVFRGWNLKDDHRPSIQTTLTDADYLPDFEQKGVDIKIGLDIAWISLEKIAQRIYLVTGDSDFIPAMKFARRSGVQVFFLTLGHGVTDELKDHADVLIEEPITSFLA
jgi:uncharacterized LabA/DUF88 family protein